MRVATLLTVLLGITGLVVTPGFSQKPPPPEQNQGQAGAYHFRKEDSGKLRQHYSNIGEVDLRSRRKLVSGGRLPDDWKGRMRPVSVEVIRDLAPPPAGYVFGRIDGYCVVYDPNTGYIADAIDLINL
jgi:Ni/Co efflux regulator RcnB